MVAITIVKIYDTLEKSIQNPIDDDDENDNFYSAVTQQLLLQGRLGRKYITCQRYDLSK